MTSECETKLKDLKVILSKINGCAIAYSGGVDSSLLVTVASEILGDNCLAVISKSSTYSARECENALNFLNERRIKYVVIESEELDIPGFSDNPRDRCYFCKKELFTKIFAVAQNYGFLYVADGTNADDDNDYRPGMQAAKELGVLFPLKDAGLTKQEIRIISKEIYNLPTADKPAMACLASRFPYGTKITRDKLEQVEIMEKFLAEHNFSVFRARYHGDVIRIELGKDELHKIMHDGIREKCISLAKSNGFKYITIDLEGYRIGSMNEALE